MQTHSMDTPVFMNQPAAIKRGEGPMLNPPTDVPSSSHIRDAYSLVGSEEDVGPRLSRFVKIKQIGSGSFGKVWLCKPRVFSPSSATTTPPLPELVVAKVMPVCKKGDNLASLQSEIHCLANTDHSNIIRFVDAHIGESDISIIMEYAEAGDLRRHIKSRAGLVQPFSESEVMLLFVQMLMGVEHMHSRQMLHRDLKTDNILLTSSGLIKVADFGFSQQYEGTVSNAVGKTYCGTPYYIAPELWMGKRYNSRADVWSLGIILYEMMALDRPFTYTSMKDLMAQVCTGTVRPLPTGYSREVYDLVGTLLNRNPSHRPRCIEALKMPFVVEHFKMLTKLVETNPHLTADVKGRWKADAEALQIRLDDLPEWVSPSSSLTTSSSLDESEQEQQQQAAAALRSAAADDVILARKLADRLREGRFEGAVWKRSTSTSRPWKSNYMYLQKGWLHLCCAKGDLDRRRSLAINTLIRVGIEVPDDASQRPYVFSIHTKDKKSTWLQAPDAQAQQKWIAVIQAAMNIAAC